MNKEEIDKSIQELEAQLTSYQLDRSLSQRLNYSTPKLQSSDRISSIARTASDSGYNTAGGSILRKPALSDGHKTEDANASSISEPAYAH